MKTWTERLPEIIAFIESGNGFAKKKAEKELEEMAIQADKAILYNKNLKEIKDSLLKDKNFRITCDYARFGKDKTVINERTYNPARPN